MLMFMPNGFLQKPLLSPNTLKKLWAEACIAVADYLTEECKVDFPSTKSDSTLW